MISEKPARTRAGQLCQHGAAPMFLLTNTNALRAGPDGNAAAKDSLMMKPESKTTEPMNVMSMLEYSKMILERVSFHPYLFKKEYRKALRRLQPVEAASLRLWVRTQKSNSSYNTPIL